MPPGESAEVIDFKTDVVDEAAFEERVRHDAPQLQEYGCAVAAMRGIPPGCVTKRLLFTAMERMAVV